MSKNQCKILLDSCSYLRLAETLHPLLGNEFGENRYCLYVIKEFQYEYDKEPRLQRKFPHLNEKQYAENRLKSLTLSRKQNKDLGTVVDGFNDYAFDNDLGTSQEDVTALARAYITEIRFVSDDTDLLTLAKAFDVQTMNTLELVKLMLDCDHVSFDQVEAVCGYIEYIPDKPRSFHKDKKRHSSPIRAQN